MGVRLRKLNRPLMLDLTTGKSGLTESKTRQGAQETGHSP